ncbi:MAG: RNA-binding domain-containing protein [Clostridia bacterium]
MVKNERNNLELKRQVSKSFLKTVSAYANYSDGEITFGVDDNNAIVGIENLEKDCLRIENMINDSISPIPTYEIKIDKRNGKELIRLLVKKGNDTPYLYKGKAFKRADTSTIEVDRFELRRLALEGLNMEYEERKASTQDLCFEKLESKLKKQIGIENINLDVLRTLNLYTKEGYYNVAGELLADENSIKFSGVDIVKFGKNISQILFRETISKKSLLTQYDRAIEIYEQYYQYDQIEGYERVKKELVPKEAFREAIANAIVHRVWDVNAYVQVSLYEDKIVINSPGGLPEGISKEEYLYSNISLLRNPIISGVFYRLNIIEQFGTGIARINNEYQNSIVKPIFNVDKNNISIVLPVIDQDMFDLNEDEKLMLDVFKDEVRLTRSEVELETEFSKSKSLRVINSLIDKNILKKRGKGPGTTYSLR